MVPNYDGFQLTAVAKQFIAIKVATKNIIFGITSRLQTSKTLIFAGSNMSLLCSRPEGSCAATGQKLNRFKFSYFTTRTTVEHTRTTIVRTGCLLSRKKECATQQDIAFPMDGCSARYHTSYVRLRTTPSKLCKTRVLYNACWYHPRMYDRESSPGSPRS